MKVVKKPVAVLVQNERSMGTNLSQLNEKRCRRKVVHDRLLIQFPKIISLDLFRKRSYHFTETPEEKFLKKVYRRKFPLNKYVLFALSQRIRSVEFFWNHWAFSFSIAKSCFPKKVRGHRLSFLVISAGNQKVGPNNP